MRKARRIEAVSATRRIKCYSMCGAARGSGFHHHQQQVKLTLLPPPLARSVDCPWGGPPGSAGETVLLHYEQLKIPENLSRFAIKQGMPGFVKKMGEGLPRFIEARRARGVGRSEPDPRAFGAPGVPRGVGIGSDLGVCRGAHRVDLGGGDGRVSQVASLPCLHGMSSPGGDDCGGVDADEQRRSAAGSGAGSAAGSERMSQSGALRGLAAVALAGGLAVALSGGGGGGGSSGGAAGGANGGGGWRRRATSVASGLSDLGRGSRGSGSQRGPRAFDRWAEPLTE
eukprot:366410-Chlamydomonas_euryale.AAC.14